MEPYIIVIFDGYFCLVRLEQAKRNYKKWAKGNLGTIDVIDVGVVDRVDWTGEFREEVERLRKKLRDYPKRGAH